MLNSAMKKTFFGEKIDKYKINDNIFCQVVHTAKKNMDAWPVAYDIIKLLI